MEELIKAVEAISQKTVFDYLIVVIPIALSVVAIGISIYTLYRQNKIALFEMRYKAVSQLKAIIMFEKSIYTLETPKVILRTFDMAFCADLDDQFEKDALVKAGIKTEQIHFDIGIIDPILKKHSVDLFDIMDCLSKIISDAIVGKINHKEKENLHRLCKQIDVVCDMLDKKIHP